MPYITKEARHYIADGFTAISSGELNYILTLVVQKYLKNNGGTYRAINDVIGALEGCKLEFYRRTVIPYEDNKIKENGDVY